MPAALVSKANHVHGSLPDLDPVDDLSWPNADEDVRALKPVPALDLILVRIGLSPAAGIACPGAMMNLENPPVGSTSSIVALSGALASFSASLLVLVASLVRFVAMSRSFFVDERTAMLGRRAQRRRLWC
jgi:hypothetical protein